MDTREAIRLENDATVFKVFQKTGLKMTVAKTYQEHLKLCAEAKTEPLSERTVRRSIKSLVNIGFISTVSREGNSTVYGIVETSYAVDPENRAMVPMGETFVTAEEFYAAIVGVKESPLECVKRENSIFDHDKLLVLQRIMAYTVISAGEAGHDGPVRKSVKDIHSAIKQLKFATGILENFVNSAIYYDHYRDRLSYENNRVAEKNPDLYQLVNEFIRGG